MYVYVVLTYGTHDVHMACARHMRGTYMLQAKVFKLEGRLEPLQRECEAARAARRKEAAELEVGGKGDTKADAKATLRQLKETQAHARTHARTQMVSPLQETNLVVM